MVLDSKVILYPVLWAIAKVIAPSMALTNHVLSATILRYAVNFMFTSLAHIESVSYHRRIINKNPPAKQLAREMDWDTPMVGSVLAFLLVERITPWLANATEFSTTSLMLCFAGHYFIVEPVYWFFHLVLHWPKVYKASHSHHHSSIITESVSGTSHPLYETLGYLLIFSMPFLLPAWCGHFSYELLYIYFVFFDIMNCIGHCNFECVPECLQWGPLKYLFYCSSYHSEHHTKFKKNYCLFCPFWDYIGNTVSRDTYALQRQSLSREGLQKTSVVFLGHGCGWINVLHMPMISPFLSTQKQVHCWWMNIFFPFCALAAIFCRAFVRSCISIQRYSFKNLACATWTVPVLAYNYASRKERPYINMLLLKAIRDAEEQGATHVGLGALNKAAFLNGGGQSLLPHLHQDCRVKIVHGNTLTAAVVYHRIRQRVGREEEIVFTGATSMVGAPVVLRLLQDGYRIRILTRSAARFAELRCRAGIKGDSLRQIEHYWQGADCRAWVLGTAATEPLGHIVPAGTRFLEFAVPISEPAFLEPHSAVGIASIRVDPQVCDLSYCHDRSCDEMPACLAATIIHGLEGFQEHEVGEVDIKMMGEWLRLAEKHGLDLDLPDEACAGLLERAALGNPQEDPQEVAARARPAAVEEEEASWRRPDAGMTPRTSPGASKRSVGQPEVELEPPGKRLRVRHPAKEIVAHQALVEKAIAA